MKISKQDIKKAALWIVHLYEFPLGWVAFIGVGVLDGLWIPHSNINYPFKWLVFIVLIFPLYFNFFIRSLAIIDFRVLKRIFPFLKRLFLLFEYTIFCGGFAYMMAVLSYLACSISYPFPLIDKELGQIDSALGLDWLALFHFMETHLHDNPSNAWLYDTLKFAYSSINYQMYFFAIWFAFFLRKDRLYEIFWIMFVTMWATDIISVFLPALGAVSLYGVEAAHKLIKPEIVESFSHVQLIRSGRSPDFMSRGLLGIVMFPSFHTASAIIYMYAFRGVKFLNYGVFVFNLIMLISIPYFGGHHFSDMIGGACVALGSIYIVRALSRKYSSQLRFSVS